MVLVVDDDENDRFFIGRAFARAGLKHPIRSLSSGLDCLRYLKGEPPYNDRTKFPLPALVVLDVNMPGMDGLDVLRWIRHQIKFERLCVVMVSGAYNADRVTVATQ